MLETYVDEVKSVSSIIGGGTADVRQSVQVKIDEVEREINQLKALKQKDRNTVVGTCFICATVTLICNACDLSLASPPNEPRLSHSNSLPLLTPPTLG